MFLDDLNLDGLDPNQVEAAAESGGLIPVGKYHARLEGVVEKTSASKGTPGEEMEFKILTGPHAGRTVKDTLWHTDNDVSRNRSVLWYHRLGLLTVDPQTKRYRKAEGKMALTDCLGAEVVIEVKHEADQKDATKFWPRLAFACWSVDDPKAKDVPKAKPGTAPAASKPATKVDVTDL